MKRKQGEFPWNNYWVYEVWHRKEGRWMVNFISMTSEYRTTSSRARYRMSTNLGRFLKDDEHVDHIDNDKSNDDINNLQILSPLENRIKQEKLYREQNPSEVSLICATCTKTFKREIKNYNYKKKKGQEKFYCSRPCGYIGLRK